MPSESKVIMLYLKRAPVPFLFSIAGTWRERKIEFRWDRLLDFHSRWFFRVEITVTPTDYILNGNTGEAVGRCELFNRCPSYSWYLAYLRVCSWFNQRVYGWKG